MDKMHGSPESQTRPGAGADTATSIGDSRKVYWKSPVLVVLLAIGLVSLLRSRPPRDATSYRPPIIEPPTPLPYVADPSPVTWPQRAQRVRQAFQHAFHGYERWAAGHDEVLPVSNGSRNNLNGWGLTVFDSLDTMYLMGLHEEFNRSLSIVARTDFSSHTNKTAPFFETVIRYLGGLLSAYALSGEAVLLDKADELGSKLAPAFRTRSGFPEYGVDLKTGELMSNPPALISDMASSQLEYAFLAKATGKKEHWNRVQQIMDALARLDLKKTGGMLPTWWDISSGEPIDTRLSVGGGADSAHEYLLKQHLLMAKSQRTSLEMYLRMTSHVLTHLTYISSVRQLLYVTDSVHPLEEPSHRQEHMSCFFPGLLALGAHALPLDNLQSAGIDLGELMKELPTRSWRSLSRHNLTKVHLWAAEGIAETCWLSYADQSSGLAPDKIHLAQHGTRRWVEALDEWLAVGQPGPPPGTQEKPPIMSAKAGRDYTIEKSEYLLRPETVESFYILWRVTGNVKWRERGWQIFLALEKESRTFSGYTCLREVDVSPVSKMDEMPSYFMAETLKYLYLLFADENPLALDEWVFNTEAHLLPVFELTKLEKFRFGLVS